MTFDDTDRGGGCRGAYRVTITGSRSTRHRAAGFFQRTFDTFLAPFARPDARFYVGGAAGIDTLALSWLAGETPASIVVVVPCTVPDQPPEAVHAIAEWNEEGRLDEVVELRASTLDTAAYHARNRWMVDHSEFVIGFPLGDDQHSGTWYTVNYAAAQGKPRLIVPI